MIPKVLDLTGYAKDDVGYDSFAKDSFGKNGFGMNGFGKNGFGKDGFGKDGYGKDGFGKDAGLFNSKITSREGWGRVIFLACRPAEQGRLPSASCAARRPAGSSAPAFRAWLGEKV